jgi:predicted outer membrane repeat protein
VDADNTSMNGLSASVHHRQPSRPVCAGSWPGVALFEATTSDDIATTHSVANFSVIKWSIRWLAAVLVFATLVALHPQPAWADTLEVCGSGCLYVTITSALADAQPGDIVWVRAGEYRVGEPVRLRPGVTLRGEDPEHPEWTIIRADGGNAVIGTGRLLTTTCVLEGFTIMPGTGRGLYIQDGAAEIIRSNIFSGTLTSFKGAGIRIDDEGTAPTIADNVFINNSSLQEGGAIYVHDASPIIIDNQFISNHSDRDGGALAIRTDERPDQQAVIVHNEFTYNTASAKGGAIYVERSKPLIQSNRILHNAAEAGAGIFVNSCCSAGQALVQGNWLFYNAAYGAGRESAGGALAIANQAQVDVDGNVLRQNSAARGGGIYIAGSAPRITNNVFVANGGAEVWVEGSFPYIINNSILGAGSPETAGIELLGASHARLVNNIIAFAGYGVRGDGVAAADILYNDVWMNVVANYEGVEAGPTNLSAEPQLRDPASGDYHLQPGSPLIDAGTTAEAPSADLDGEARPVDGDGDGIAEADIGADEYHPPPATATPTSTPTATPTLTPTATRTPPPTLSAQHIYLPIIRKP